MIHELVPSDLVYDTNTSRYAKSKGTHLENTRFDYVQTQNQLSLFCF
jgi:hypothetical protein